ARAARQQLAPPGWPGPDDPALRAALAARAWAAVVGRPLAELRTVLEASGGRGVVLHDPAGPGRLPAVAILVDAAGVVTDYRVGEGTWRPFTEEVHAKDSGGGKAVTLLQPMLAALAALYAESASAPRPLWLDEAFTGVDDANRATMLGLLVTFDLDFLLAGPATLVTTAQVPSAAIWFISRAPAPDPGVDLSLMLWSGDEAAQTAAGQNRRSESSSVPRIAS
ncbi:MAG TPA: SbcC/MukB-like Walker B domain-containing protein, partial [Streptosporangiaceae bacterium]|nr:SbcC/MukB-like Walker B domain-containing protein [Streptosporangiaceae bacterium]